MGNQWPSATTRRNLSLPQHNLPHVFVEANAKTALKTQKNADFVFASTNM